MNYISLGSYPLSTLTSAVGLSSRTGGITSSTNANPVVVTDNNTPAHHGLLYGTITAATGSPVQFTSTAHGLTSGDGIIVTGVVGLSDVNCVLNAGLGQFTVCRVQVIDANTFTVYGPRIVQSAPPYSSGGTWYRPEVFRIEGHATNTSANGSWAAIGASVSTFTLLGATGNGVGGATGTWRTIPRGTKGALIQAVGGTVNWRDDGVDPTASTTDGSNALYSGDEPILFDGNLWKFRAINQSGGSGATLNVEFVKW